MRGEELGRRSLQLDAGYCAVAGAKLVVGSRWLSGRVGVPPSVLSGLGVLTLAWSGVVVRAARSQDWRRSVATVGAANLAAATVTGSLAGKARSPFFRVVLALVALEVAAFAGSQAAALATSEGDLGRDNPTTFS
jgi:hypothetical protein